MLTLSPSYFTSPPPDDPLFPNQSPLILVSFLGGYRSWVSGSSCCVFVLRRPCHCQQTAFYNTSPFPISGSYGFPIFSSICPLGFGRGDVDILLGLSAQLALSCESLF